MTLLHIGCGNRKYKGFVNVDKEMDISKPWPYEDESVDGIVSMMVLQCLQWKDLVFAFKEMKRVLKPGGVMRHGVNLVEANFPRLFLYGANINLFSFDLLKNILVDRLGFSSFRRCEFRESALPELARVDNRRGKGTLYVEAVK